VYSELLGFKQEVIATTNTAMSQLENSASVKEVATTDRLLLDAERQRFERRLRFWEKREAQLTGS
jgi:hypothetical protein